MREKDPVKIASGSLSMAGGVSSLAMEYLQTTKMSTEAIAIKVGFSDGSNFRRAFKRWTGKTTRQMRYGGL